jgi:hypothetical protein
VPLEVVRVARRLPQLPKIAKKSPQLIVPSPNCLHNSFSITTFGNIGNFGNFPLRRYRNRHEI